MPYHSPIATCMTVGTVPIPITVQKKAHLTQSLYVDTE